MTVIRFGYSKNIRWYALAGWIIRTFEKWTTGLDASHCYVDIFEPKHDNVYRVESIWPEGRMSKNMDWSNHYKTIVYYDFYYDGHISEVLEWCKHNVVGKKYSLNQNVFVGACGIILKLFNSKNWSLIEKIEFNGRNIQNCSESQIMILAKFFNMLPTEGLDNFSVGEARDLVKSAWEFRGNI